MEFILTKQDPLTFDDVLFLHSIVANNLHSNAGKFAMYERTIDINIKGVEENVLKIPPMNEIKVREEFENLLTKLHSQTNHDSIIELLCEWFVKQTTEQWFDGCNTRVAFLVLNKLLIENNINHLWLYFRYDNSEISKRLAFCCWKKWTHFENKDPNNSIEAVIQKVEFDIKQTDIDIKKTFKDFNLKKTFFY